MKLSAFPIGTEGPGLAIYELVSAERKETALAGLQLPSKGKRHKSITIAMMLNPKEPKIERALGGVSMRP